MTASLLGHVTFDVLGDAAPQGSKRAFVHQGRAVMTESSGKKLRPWRQEIGQTAAAYVRKPFEGAVWVELSFYLPRRKVHRRKRGPSLATKRPDADKLARAALDALTGVAFLDDSQVTTLVVHKRITDEDAPPRLSIRIAEDV